MNLGDAFIRRKQIAAEIENWTNRLALAGRNSYQYETKTIDGDKAYLPISGSTKDFKRTYTIEECQIQIDKMVKEDLDLALRISVTNQKAMAKLVDLDGKEKLLSIPALLVLRNEIAPKMEEAARKIPIQAKGVDVMKADSSYIKWRTVTPQFKRTQELSDKGHKIENDIIEKYHVEEVLDYGWPERKVFDEIDKIHLWLQRIKNAINDANKTELVALDQK